MPIPARYLAATVIAGIVNQQGSLATQLPQVLHQANPKDSALISQLVYGTCRYFPQLSITCTQLLRQPIQAKHTIVQSLLLVGLYEISHMRTPTHAAVSSTVEAAKMTQLPWAASLCNGVLREFIRQQAAIAEQYSSDATYASNHPSWLQAKLAHHWPQHWQGIVQHNDQQAPMTLRVNQRQTNRADYLAQLAAMGIAAIPCAYSPWGIQLHKPCAVTLLPKFTQGMVSVQDEAAQLAPLVLDVANEQRVLDACSAPGGKMCHILEQHDVHVTAVETSAKRMTRLKDNLQRLQLDANVICADANDLDSWWDNIPFDRILLDAPCSATGVIRRHPDIKLLRTSDDILALCQQQLSLLTNLWPALQVGGILVYATCSVLKQENERVIKRFLANQANACEVIIDAEWGIACDHGRQLFPQTGGHDGFYYAKLQKLAV